MTFNLDSTTYAIIAFPRLDGNQNLYADGRNAILNNLPLTYPIPRKLKVKHLYS